LLTKLRPAISTFDGLAVSVTASTPSAAEMLIGSGTSPASVETLSAT
jgi:hypothetical protein